MPTTPKAYTLNYAERTENIFHLPTTMEKDELVDNTVLFMLSNLNQTVNPCDDFYEFACGNWAHNKKVPEFGRTLSLINTMQYILDDLAMDFLENKIKGSQDIGEQKAKLFYKSCVNTKPNLTTGLNLLLQEEYDIYSSLKFTGEYDWLEVNFMSPYNIYPLLPLIINEWASASGEYEITLSLPQPYIISYFLNNSLKNEFLASFDIKSNDLDNVLQFEEYLISVATQRQPRERKTLAEFLLHHKSDTLNWNIFFQKAFPNQTENYWYVNNEIANINELHDFLSNTPLLTLRSYVQVCTVLKFYKIWRKVITDRENQRAQCRFLTEKYFRYAMMPWFMQQLFTRANHRDINEIAQYIKQYFLNSIQNYKWLSETSKRNVRQKLQDLEIVIGFSEKIISADFTKQHYGDLVITSNWFENLQNLEAQFTLMLKQSVYQKLVPPFLSPFELNSFYNNVLNLVYISMGVMQMPLYHKDLPAVLKFAGVGVFIAHELAHAFDSDNQLHDFDEQQHKYSNNAWLSEQSLENFRKRYLCLKNQYEQFYYRGKSIDNSELSMEENVADNAMLHLSFEAYLNFSGGWQEGLKKPIRNFDFNINQIFFIKFAQTFCNGAVEMEEKLNESKIHVFDEFRTLLPIQNTPEFAKAFNCKLGSPMNPVKKCRLW
ncbi:endothelin-converting enzyme homolog [Lucilia sericata]|uniref:endothelin-converting enzyme homolog n=1 Tax=Lucilia sericata TaxID=13632 RepID=UPI0018A8381A|nr:endothelin-converting enzyme homolog [Lucilia sericata]